MSEGQIIIGGYELRNCVATGNATQIWEVVQQGAQMQLAMKLLMDEAHKDAAEKAVLKHEYKVGSSFEHPGIVRVHQLELNRDHGFIIMDYFRSPSLKQQISSAKHEVQSRFRKIVEMLCQAFGHIHERGWLHRDIKPENILVSKSGEVRVIDFSLSSKKAGGLGKLLSGKQAIRGTRTYISPETILKKVPTVETDIYSFGVTLFELVTGVPPFAGLSPNDLLKKHLSEKAPPPSVLNDNVTPELDQLILKMLAKKPKERPSSMQEVYSAVRNLRPFKEDPAELHARKVQAAKDEETMSVDKRLDSRADAERTEKGLPAPVKPVKKQRRTAPIKELADSQPVRKKPEEPAQPAAPQQPQMPYPGMMPGMPPQMPMQPMPQMPYPGMMPGMPPQMPMQQPMPQMPMPQMPVPQQPMQQPAQQPPPQNPAPAGSPLSRPEPPPSPKKDDEEKEDLDFMTELPDVF